MPKPEQWRVDQWLLGLKRACGGKGSECGCNRAA